MKDDRQLFRPRAEDERRAAANARGVDIRRRHLEWRLDRGKSKA